MTENSDVHLQKDLSNGKNMENIMTDFFEKLWMTNNIAYFVLWFHWKTKLIARKSFSLFELLCTF